jgi:hypothetical protein
MLTVSRRILVSAPRQSVESFLASAPERGVSRTTGRLFGVSLPVVERKTTVRAVNGGTVIEYDEAYRLPVLLTPLKPLLRGVLDSALETELHAVKEGAEALNRRLQLENLE